MAYIRGVNVQCQQQGCKKVGDWELIGRTNATYGKFCKKHADKRLDELLAVEKRFTAEELGA